MDETKAGDAEEVAALLDSLLSRALERFGEPARRRALAAGRHPPISLPRTTFLSLLMTVQRLMADDFDRVTRCPDCGLEEVALARFVDVGCGVADKLVLASELGFEAHGIEVDPRVVRRARRTFPLRACAETRYTAPPLPHLRGGGAMTIYPAEALEFDFAGFDVLYYYRPFADDAQEKALERRIWRQARPGAFVIACSGLTEAPRAFREIRGPGFDPSAKVYRRSKRGREGSSTSRRGSGRRRTR